MQLDSRPAEKAAAMGHVSDSQPRSLSPDSPRRCGKRKRSQPPPPPSMTPSTPQPYEGRTRIGMACESCNRFKLKCSVARPCQNCVRRGTECVEKPSKPRACLECKLRKIKCDQGQPCEKCVKHNRVCRTEQEIYRASSASPSTASSVANPASVVHDPFEAAFDFAQVWSIDSIAHGHDDEEPMAFDLSAFEFDDFPSVTPFWPDPTFHTPPSAPLISLANDNPGVVFDDFDRSRLLHDLALLPAECQGDLPSSVQLTTILHQYFQYVDPYTPIIHVPSFSVKSCPTVLLLLLLAIGDVYSADTHQTLERWARKAFRFLVRKEIELFETSDYEIPLTTIQALAMWISELVYSGSGDSKTLLYAHHCRLTLAHACQSFLEEKPEQEGVDAASWISWIKRETTRRTMMLIYRTETMVTMYLGVPPLLKVSELKLPLPDCDELWYADSHSKWLNIRQGKREETSLRFDQVLSDLMHGGNLVARCTGIVGLHVVAVGLHELISMARRLREVDGYERDASSILLQKSREVLENWKLSWQSNERNTSTTKAQYIAIMSTWCCAELSLTAPEHLLRMGHRVTTSKDVPALMEQFLKEADHNLSTMDGYTFNNLMTAAAAALYHVEVISEFKCLDDCPDTVRATVYPNVVASFFVGGLCLWYCIRVLEQIGRYVPDTKNQILPRLKKAVEAIRWQDESPLRENKSVTYLLGDLLMRTKVWGTIAHLTRRG